MKAPSKSALTDGKVTTNPLENFVSDLYGVLGTGKVEADEASLKELGEVISDHVKKSLTKYEPRGYLSASMLGSPCDRKTWLQVHKPEWSEGIPGYTKLKFLIGHIHEEIILALAKWAGYDVQHRQSELTVNGIPGHLDAVIDGELVDVKSANSRSMQKFRGHKLEEDDPFGYLKQLDFYRKGLHDAALIDNPRTQTFIASDKELGHIVLDTYKRDARDDHELLKTIERKQAVIASPDIPERGFSDVEFGRSGNMALGTECKYCEFKTKCWPGLRTFLYAKGPVFLTKVKVLPDVPEVSVNYDGSFE